MLIKMDTINPSHKSVIDIELINHIVFCDFLDLIVFHAFHASLAFPLCRIMGKIQGISRQKIEEPRFQLHMYL